MQTREDLSPERCRELLDSFPGVAVVDDPAAGRYPMPIDAAGRDEVFVGPDPARPLARALPEHVGRVGQPAQGRRHERRAARRADRRARPDRGRAPGRSPARRRRCRGGPRSWPRSRCCLRSPAPAARRRARRAARHLCRGDAPGPGRADLAVRLRPGARRRALRRLPRRRAGRARSDTARFVDDWLLAEHPLRVRRARARPGRRERGLPAARITTPAVAGVRDRPLPAAADGDRRRGRVADLRARDDRAALRSRGRAARGRRARRRARAAPRRAGARPAAGEPPTATSGSRTASWAASRASHTPVAAPDRLLVRRDRRLRHRHTRRAREPAPPVGRPGGRPRDHDRRQRADLRHRGRVPAASCWARCAT